MTDADGANPWLMTERTSLSSLDGTRWRGAGELWLDPLVDEADRHDCSAVIEGSRLSYTWEHDGREHRGRVDWTEGRLRFRDSFHQADDVACRPVADHPAEVALAYEYDPGVGPLWGWRVLLSVRPTGQLVLQMQNIAPWGEEARAARMILQRNGSD